MASAAKRAMLSTAAAGFLSRLPPSGPHPQGGGGRRVMGGRWRKRERERERARVLTPGGNRLEYKPAPCALCWSLPSQGCAPGRTEHRRRKAAWYPSLPVLRQNAASLPPGEELPMQREEETLREQETVRPTEKPGLGVQQTWVWCLVPVVCPVAGWGPPCS